MVGIAGINYILFAVIQLNDVVERKDVSEIPIRTVTIPGVPYYLAVSCDDTILSVCYAIDSLSFIDLYSVQSFLSAVRKQLSYYLDAQNFETNNHSCVNYRMLNAYYQK